MKKFLMSLGIFTLILLVVIVAGGLIAHTKEKKYSLSVEPFIDNFYARYNNHDDDYIYNTLFSSKARESNNLDALKNFINGSLEKLGPVNGREKGAWRLYTGTDGVIYSIQYQVDREIADSVDSFVLKRNNESWLIDRYHINSDKLFE